MQRLEVSCAVRLIYTSLGAKGFSTDGGKITAKKFAVRIFFFSSYSCNRQYSSTRLVGYKIINLFFFKCCMFRPERFVFRLIKICEVRILCNRGFIFAK